MRKLLRYTGYLLVFLALAIAIVISYVKTALPDVGAPEDITVDKSRERIERGRYLANSVMVCMDCHSTRDWTKFSGPLMPGTLGQGGERFDQQVNMPGVIFSRNITPAGIANYTDGELFRLITTGVTREGKAMFPLMPYRYYGRMDREDIYDVIAFIRSLDPIANPVPESELDFPMNILINAIPQTANLQRRPEKTDTIAYGRYLANAAACVECHTRDNKGQIIEEFAYGGGREFKFPDGSVVRSANITPHKTGIGAWTEEIFVRRFKLYADSTQAIAAVAPGDFNSYMPWTMYAQMEEEDLRAIFAYLKTVTPMDNTVERFTRPAQH